MNKTERLPRPGRALLFRAALAGFLIVLLTAGAVSASGLLLVEKEKEIILGSPDRQVRVPELTRAEVGEARTFLILGSDQRWEDTKNGDVGRSDSIMLVRVDPDKSSIAMMNIPRDLKVAIPGVLHPDKINAAYANGGPKLTVKTVQELFEKATGEPFPINNVINVNFGGFRRVVDYMGGVYVDVDRHYFNDNSGRDKYATIDVKGGYQRLEGQKALDYVRFRHKDNDFLRGARQQDFMRQLRSQPSAQKLLSFDNRDEVGHIFSRYLQVDQTFRSTKQILSLMRLGMYSSGKPVRQVRFNAGLDGNYVVASPGQLRATWDEFMNPKASAEVSKKEGAQSNGRRKGGGQKGNSSSVPGLQDSRRAGEDQAITPGVVASKSRLPFYFPSRTMIGSVYEGKEPRIYTITDYKGKKHPAYRLVLSRRTIGEYYGIQGTTWKTPPILDNPSETRKVRGRTLLLYYDGSHLRIVAWRSKNAVYWVSNTLSRSLSNKQMVAIAASLTRLGGAS